MPLRTSVVLILAVSAWLYVVSGFSRTVGAQSQTPADAASHGAAVFEKTCASCHGAGAAGGRASALNGSDRVRAMSDGEIETVITNGTSTGMPPFRTLAAPELSGLVAYLRSLNPASTDTPAAGDAAAGERFFHGAGRCGTCHIIAGRGAAIGPELSNAGRRLNAAELAQALVDPAADDRAGVCPGAGAAE